MVTMPLYEEKLICPLAIHFTQDPAPSRFQNPSMALLLYCTWYQMVSTSMDRREAPPCIHAAKTIRSLQLTGERRLVTLRGVRAENMAA